jgi:hypothetical protein
VTVSDSLLLVFNELSAPPVTEGEWIGTQWLESFSEILADPRCGTSRILVTPPNFLQFPLGGGYSIGRWLKTNKRGDEPRWRRVNLLVDKRRDFAYFDSQDDDSEYSYSGRPVSGLPLAHREDGLAVSFCSDGQWDVPSVEFEKTWATDVDVETCTLSVLHASRASHLDPHIDWLKHWTAGPANGKELWVRRAELFPSLDFCESVEEQIRGLSGTEARFKVTSRGLAALQRYCESWDTPNFDIHRLGNGRYASGESQSTLNTYSKERTIRCPDGETRVFQWHLKKDDTRIHFFDFPATKRILVGYVGNHLPI